MVPRKRTGDDLPRAEPPPLVLNSKLTEGGTAMRRRIVAFTVAALLTEAAGVSAQIYAPQSVERYFRLEWEATRGRKGPAVEGYVYNTGPRNAEHMRLQIERLDVSGDRKSTRLNSSHGYISYAVFCLKKKKKNKTPQRLPQ